MTDYGTIKIPEATYERHNERRQELGLTWEAYIDDEAPELDRMAREVINSVAVEADSTGRVDDDEIADAVVRRFDYAELASAVADELEVRMS